jgi:pimeloyl-ACP methyl ester carboxylesterase
MTGLTLAQALADVPEGPRTRFLELLAQHPMRHVAVAGNTLEYVACGRGEQVLVHLPGLLSDARAAAHLAPLADRFRSLTPTYLDTQDVAAQVDAVVRMLDAERVERAAVIGQTLGGYLGQVIASAHPDRISHLVLAHAGVPEPAQMPSLTAMYRLVQLLPFALTSAYITRTLLAGVAKASRHPDVDPDEARLILAYFRFRQSQLTRTTVLARYGLARELGRAFPRYRDGLRGWPGKILVCYGRGAWCHEGHVARLRELHASVEAHQLDAGGHWNFYLQPAASLQLVERFVRADDRT